jgi:LysM repeat protein
MAPVVLDHGRIGVAIPAAARDRPAGQLALGALMLIAFAAIALARLSGVGDGGFSAVVGSPSPRATLAAVLPTPTPSPVSTPTPSATASPALTPAPSPTQPARTYKVKRGETLSGIAARFGTTVRVLIDLNDIKDPSRIPVGAVLELPPEAGEP